MHASVWEDCRRSPRIRRRLASPSAQPRSQRCPTLRRFLGRNQVSHEWLAPDDPQLPARWPGRLPQVDEYPAIRCSDGIVRERPSIRDLARVLGLQTSPRTTQYDTMIIGGGPAGLAAAVYGASEGLRTIVIEREAPGGQAGTSSRIENYLGFPNGVSGDELASRALQQARRLGAEILVTRTVQRLDSPKMEIVLDGDERVRARTVILATGVAWRRVAIQGAERLIGKGVYYGAARSEANATHGLDLHLIGAGNSAGQAALYFANHARSVTLVVRGDSLEKSMSQYLIDQLRRQSNIGVLLKSEVQAAHGDANLTAIDIRDGVNKKTHRVECGGLFVFIGADAETDWLPGDIARDTRGYVLTGDDVVKAGRWSHERDPCSWRPAFPASSPAVMSGLAPSSASLRPLAKAAWRSPSSSSSCRKRCTEPPRGGGSPSTTCALNGGQARNRTTDTRIFSPQQIVASTCPRCGHEQVQSYSHLALSTLLWRGDPIEGYCLTCQEYWQLDSHERHDLVVKLTS